MPSSFDYSSTTTSITFTFTLTNPFNYANYYEIGVTNMAFTNGASSLAAGSTSESKPTDPNSEIYSAQVGFTITQFGSTSLVAGHTYTFYGYARAKNGNYYRVPEEGTPLSVTMQSNPTPQAAAPYDLACTKRRDKPNTDTSFYLDFCITVPNNTRSLTVEMSKFSDFRNKTDEFSGRTLGALTNISGNTYGFTLTAPQQITTYYVRARVEDTSYNLSNWCDTKQISTPLKKTWLSQSYMAIGEDGTYCSCYLKKDEWNDEVNADWFSYMSFEFDFNGVSQAITYKRMGTTYTALSSPEYTAIFTATEIDNTANVNKGFAVLLPNQTTTITARVRLYSYVNGAYLQPVDANGNDYVAVYTLSYTAPNAISEFDWNTSNGNATAGQTQTAKTAITNGGYAINFSYLVWNDIVDKIEEAIGVSNNSWDSTYATLANTKMSQYDKTLTAVRFNSARYNVGIHYPTGIQEVSQNQDVDGNNHLLKLVTKLNEWIRTLQ